MSLNKNSFHLAPSPIKQNDHEIEAHLFNATTSNFNIHLKDPLPSLVLPKKRPIDSNFHHGFNPFDYPPPSSFSISSLIESSSPFKIHKKISSTTSPENNQTPNSSLKYPNVSPTSSDPRNLNHPRWQIPKRIVGAYKERCISLLTRV
ncbi:hypothetical protein HMI54_015544 [Coelomomyces lativittatus]|nr:hypothetical protein HMI56_001720 [Coelomomyces lativittatus]KAJ1512720.1 hypothetical protein HMI54_015544 [Coelomomyces lativittatus]